MDFQRLTRDRLTACHQLREAALALLGDVSPRKKRSWIEQRQLELAARSMQTMQGLLLLAQHGLWAQTYALARMLVEDAAVAYWLVDHPDVDALKQRWDEHLDATRYGDLLAQRELGLPIDDFTLEWYAGQDASRLEQLAGRHRYGASHWTGKSVAQLAQGAAGRGLSRDRWDWRTSTLLQTQKRLLRVVSAGLHHSPAACQNWYTPPEQLLPDGLKAAWLVFELHAWLAVEIFAPAHVERFVETIRTQAPLVFPEGETKSEGGEM